MNTQERIVAQTISDRISQSAHALGILGFKEQTDAILKAVAEINDGLAGRGLPPLPSFTEHLNHIYGDAQ